MKAIVDRKEFLEVLGKVKSVVRAKATLPIITNVLLQAEGCKVTVTGTDLESFLVGNCKAKVLKTGGICISPKSAEAFLKAVDAETVTIEVKGKPIKEMHHQLGAYNEKHEWETLPDIEVEKIILTTILTAGDASISPECFDAEDFPPVPECKGKRNKVTGLTEALKRVSYAMAKESTRPVLTGVSFRPNKGKLELAAADGFRLAVTAIKGTIPSDIVVPLKAIGLLERVMPNANSIKVVVTEQPKAELAALGTAIEAPNTDTVVISIPVYTAPPVVQFEGDGLILTARATDGTFPNYQQLIPKGGTELRVQQADLLKALKVVNAIQPSSGIVKLVANGKGHLAVSGKNDEATTEAKIPAIGKKCRTAVNIRYLSDVLQRTEGEVRIWVDQPSSPIKVEHMGSTHVVMPMFVQWGDEEEEETTEAKVY